MKSIHSEEIESFCQIYETPEFITPWLHKFVEKEEIEFVLALAENKQNSEWDQNFLDRCYQRCIISFDDAGKMIPANFHDRFEIWTMFEGWKDIPEDIRNKLKQWHMDYYIATQSLDVKKVLETGKRDKSHPWSEYTTMEETLKIIEKIPHIYLWPCICRSMFKGCKKPEYVCLIFDNNRNLGWEISKEKAAEIVLMSHKKGLMQNAEISIQPDGTITGAICNCCSDCCLLQQMAKQLDLKSV